MKKLFALFVFMVAAFTCFGQISQPNLLPNYQQYGSPTTWTRFNGIIYPFGGLVNAEYADTATANLSIYKVIPGIIIRVGSDLYLRNSTATKWEKMINQTTINNIIGCYRLLNGGLVTWSGVGLTMDISPANYVIGCNFYNSPQTQVTLNAADPTLPRMDVIAVTTSNTVVVITGTPAINPAKPQVDPTTQLELTSILIPAGATTPPGITQKIIYDENIGSPSEFVSSTDMGGAVNFSGTNTPYHLSINAEVNAGSNGHLVWTSSSLLPISDYSTLKLFVRLDAAESPGFDVGVNISKGNTDYSLPLNISDYGFTTSVFGAYQVITIPISDFAFPAIHFDKLYLKIPLTSTKVHFDYIQLQSGIQIGQSPFITDIRRKNGTDTVQAFKNGIWNFAFIDSTGGSGGSYSFTTPLINSSGNISINGLSGYGSNGQLIRSTGSALQYFTPAYILAADTAAMLSKYMRNVYKKPGTDSVFKDIGGVISFAFIDSTGAGGSTLFPISGTGTATGTVTGDMNNNQLNINNATYIEINLSDAYSISGNNGAFGTTNFFLKPDDTDIEYGLHSKSTFGGIREVGIRGFGPENTFYAIAAGDTSSVIIDANTPSITLDAFSVRFKDGSLGSASNGYVWKLINSTTGEGGWVAESGGLSDGDKGDITVSGSGATFTIDNDVVTFAKMQNIAQDRLLGRLSSGTGDIEQLDSSQVAGFIGMEELKVDTTYERLMTLGSPNVLRSIDVTASTTLFPVTKITDTDSTLRYRVDTSGLVAFILSVAPGGGGSGTVNSGTINTLAYYPATGTTVDDLAAITANRALISDANGLPIASSVTNTELGYVSGVTSAIQTQLDAKIDGSGAANRVAYFSDANTLTSNADFTYDGSIFKLSASNPKIVTSNSGAGGEKVALISGTALSIFSFSNTGNFGIQQDANPETSAGSSGYSMITYGSTYNTLLGTNMAYSIADISSQLGVITTASKVGLKIMGASSQTANLQEWQNSSATILSYVDKDGNISVPDDPYAAGWNGNTEVPTKNAIYDKIESIKSGFPVTLIDTTNVIRLATKIGTSPDSMVIKSVTFDYDAPVIASIDEDTDSSSTIRFSLDPEFTESVYRERYIQLLADDSNSTTTLANASNMWFEAEDSTMYEIEFTGAFQSAVTTTGIQMALDIPDGQVIGGMIAPTSNTAAGMVFQKADNAINGGTGTTDVPTATSNTWVQAKWNYFSDAGGTVNLKYASEVGSSQVKLMKNISWMRIRKIKKY